MQNNYEKFRSKFRLIQSINVSSRPYQISINFDCSTILVFQIDSKLLHFQRNNKIWNLVVSQKLPDQYLSVQLNQSGTILVLITRKFGYFWIEYLIFNKRKWILKNQYKLNQDPDPYVSVHHYSISQNLQLCAYQFQWNRNYQRINAFSITSFFKRIHRQKIKGSEVIFSNQSFIFVVPELDKLGLKVYRYFQFHYILYQTQSQINSYIIHSDSSIIIHSKDLIFWNFITNQKSKIKTPYDIFQEGKSQQIKQIGNLLLVQFNNEVFLFEFSLEKLKYITTYQCQKFLNQFSSDKQIMIEMQSDKRIEIYLIMQ